MQGARRIALAIDALRHGWSVSVSSGDAALNLLPVETAMNIGEDINPKRLIISAARADTLKLTNQKAAASPDSPVQIKLADTLTTELALAIADPALDMRRPMKGPFLAEPMPAQAQEAAGIAMDLARRAGILPAFYILTTQADDDTPVTAADLNDFAQESHLQIASRAKLPVEAHDDAEIVAFRSTHDMREHIALIIGRRDASVPVVRVHSECLTGDILGSLKCDCGPQLHEAMDKMAQNGWGVLLYLRQEGRGIGLINKLRAYSLQDQGFDTVDANNRLGLPTEARDFGVAARMLGLLNIETIKLLTNNPQKVDVLAKHGVDVAERLPLKIQANRHNAHYLETKKTRTGHQL